MKYYSYNIKMLKYLLYDAHLKPFLDDSLKVHYSKANQSIGN